MIEERNGKRLGLSRQISSNSCLLYTGYLSHWVHKGHWFAAHSMHISFRKWYLVMLVLQLLLALCNTSSERKSPWVLYFTTPPQLRASDWALVLLKQCWHEDTSFAIFYMILPPQLDFELSTLARKLPGRDCCEGRSRSIKRKYRLRVHYRLLPNQAGW